MQHIQMAVQAGYLNPQILNQSLAPTTLVLLNSMLTQINALQKLNQQMNSLPPQAPHANNPTILQLNVHIAKTKQQITNIQVRASGRSSSSSTMFIITLL
jgi:trinucleotide repeat-containing gene 6 protein